MDRRLMHSMVVALMTVAVCHTPAQAQNASNDVYQAIVTRQFGTAVGEMQAIEKIIHDAKPADYPAIENSLMRILEAPGATMPGRQFALRMLPFVASPRCVPAVAKLLREKNLSHMARSVFRGMEGKEIETALRDALADTQGVTRIGIINTIGDRKDQSSLKTLSTLIRRCDDDTARSILNAMGRIGGVQAAAALDKYKPAETLRPAWATAYLCCADSVAAGGEARRALRMYSKLVEGAFPSAVRVGAFKVVLGNQKEEAAPLVVQMLSSRDELIKGAALAAVLQTPGHAATLAFVDQLSGLKPDAKALLVDELAVRGDAEGVTASVNKLVADPDAGVRAAAIKALGRVGDVSSVAVLAPLLKDPAAQEVARRTLLGLTGKGIPEALIRQAGSGDPAVRAGVLNVLSDRKESAALPVARKAAADNDADVRQAALRMLSKLGSRDDLKPLCDSLLTAKSDSERTGLTRAIQAVALRIEDKAARADGVVECFAKADAQAKALLLPVLATLGGDKALATLRAALGDAGAVHKAAVGALAEWADASPMADLRKAAKEESDASAKISALRGFVKMVGISALNAGEKAEAYREAMGLASRPEEKIQVLADVGNVVHPDALKVVEPCLADGTVKSEAFVAYEKIAEAIAESQPAAARSALERVVAETTDDALREKAKGALKNIK